MEIVITRGLIHTDPDTKIGPIGKYATRRILHTGRIHVTYHAKGEHHPTGKDTIALFVHCGPRNKQKWRHFAPTTLRRNLHTWVLNNQANSTHFFEIILVSIVSWPDCWVLTYASSFVKSWVRNCAIFWLAIPILKGLFGLPKSSFGEHNLDAWEQPGRHATAKCATSHFRTVLRPGNFKT